VFKLLRLTGGQAKRKKVFCGGSGEDGGLEKITDGGDGDQGSSCLSYS